MYNETIYIGAYGGLICYDGRRFETVEGVSSAVTLFCDSRGRLWAGTSEMSAACIERGAVTVYGTGEGLPATSVRGFYELENGDILMATRSGLACLDAAGNFPASTGCRRTGRCSGSAPTTARLS